MSKKNSGASNNASNKQRMNGGEDEVENDSSSNHCGNN